MNRKHSLLLVLLMIFSQGSIASSLVLGVGATEDRTNKHHTVIDLGLEANELESFYGLKPYANVFLADETYYVGAGLVKEFALSQRWQIGLVPLSVTTIPIKKAWSWVTTSSLRPNSIWATKSCRGIIFAWSTAIYPMPTWETPIRV